MDQIKQIDQNQDNNINTQELLDAMKPNGFLSNENNLEDVGKLLSNEELSEEDKALVDSLKSTIDNEINTILEKGTATEEDIMLINIRKELLGENDNRVQRLKDLVNNYSRNNTEITQDNQEVDIALILQELDNEIETALNSPLNNLQELGIDISLQNNKKGLGINWINILNNIKCLDDLGNITKENVNTYLNIPNNVSKENYGYIAENLKNILYTHLAIHPERKAILQKGGYASGISIESVAKVDAYEISLLKQIENLQKKSLEKQVEIIVSKLPNNSDLLDLWLKQTLNSDQHNQEAVLINLFDKIPVELSDKFFQTCEKNSFINELKNNYALYWLNKNNCIKSDGDKYCFLDRANPKSFSKLYGKGIVLSDELNFDDLYNHTKKFYEHLNAFGFDTTIPLNEIIKFLNAQDNYYKKIKNASDICERETKYAADSYNPNYMPVGGSPSAGHAHLGGEIHAAKVKFQSEKSKACAELEKEYVKVLLQKKPKPIGDIMGISGAGIALKFDKDPGRGTLDERADKIVRDTFTEQLGDQREKFKYDIKNDRQAAFGSAMGMIGGIAGSAVAAIFTKNIWATSAGFTLGLRLGNGVGQELWNGGEYLYEQISGNTIDDGNNGVQSFGQGFLRGVGALDQNYEYVGTAKFLSGLGFDYLSTIATFGLSQKFGGFLGKLEGVKFAGGALKFGMEELILENFFVDIPMNIVQTGFETFTGIDDGITIGNTAIGNQHTVEGQGGYKSGSISDMLRAMKDATSQNLSLENLSQTFFNTVLYGGFLEGGGAAIKKMKGYLPAGQVSNFTERSAAAATAFVGLTNFMSSKNINFNKDGVCIDTKTNQKIEESDSRFQELCTHLNAVEATKAGVIESFESIMETQKQMVSDPENKTGLLFRLGLISPTNTPLNILKKKKKLVEKKLNEAKSKGDNTKIAQLEKLLDIYTDAENKLNTDTEGESIQLNPSEQISQFVTKIDNSVFERVINSQELKQIASQEIENGTLEIGENGEILNVYVEVNGEKKPSKLFQSLTNGGLSPEQSLKSRLQIRTTNFKEWFGDWQNDPENASKIVDENGEPLVMWHGTTRQFNEFSHDAPRNYENIGNTKDWFYFSNAYNFSEKEYSGIGQINQALTDFYSLYAENYEGNDRLENFTNKRNYFIEGLSNGKTEKKNSNLRFEGKENQINQQLAYCLNGQELKIENFEKREWIRKVEYEDGEIESIPVKIYVPKGNVYNNPLPFFIKGNNISQGNDFTRNQVISDMDYNINKAIENGNNETDIIRVDDKSTGNIVLGVRDATQIKSAIGNDGTFSPESGKFNDYFGKKPKLAKNIDSKKAYNNSEKMDNYLSQIQENGENLGAILTELREEINKEYKSVTNTDKDLNLTDEQLLSVLDAHEKDGILGELTLGQLRQKVKILAETITDPKVRRFLLEAGFCGVQQNLETSNVDTKQETQQITGHQESSNEGSNNAEKTEGHGTEPQNNENSLFDTNKGKENITQLGEEISSLEKQIAEKGNEISNLEEGNPHKAELEKEKKDLEEQLKKSKKRKESLEIAIETVEQWNSQYDPEVLQSQIDAKKEKLSTMDKTSKEYKELEKEIKNLEKKQKSGIHETLVNGEKLIQKTSTREKLVLKLKKLKFELKNLYYNITNNTAKIEETKLEIKNIEKEIHTLDNDIAKIIETTYQGLRNLKGLDDTELRELTRTYYTNILKPIQFILINPSQTFESDIVNNEFQTQREISIEGNFEKNQKMFSSIREKINRIRLGNYSTFKTMADIDTFIEENFGECPAEKQILLNLKKSLEENIGVDDKRMLVEERAVIFLNSVSYMLDFNEAYPGSSPNKVYNILDTNQNKLIHQHIQDKHYLTGSSHDVLHILRGNMNMAENYMGNMSAKERVITRQIIIDHDMGYTSVFNKFLSSIRSDVFFDATKDHPLWSSQFIEDNAQRYIDNFGYDEYTIIKNSVTGHSKPDTVNLPTETETNTSNEPRSKQINAVISVVDCVAASADYKSAFLFSQPQIAGEFLGVYIDMNEGNIGNAIDGLHKIIETANTIEDPNLKGAIFDALNSLHLTDPATGEITLDKKMENIEGMEETEINKARNKLIEKLHDPKKGGKALSIFCKANGIVDQTTVTDDNITPEQVKNYLKFDYINDRVSFPYEKYLSQYGVRVSVDSEGKTIIGEAGGVVTATFELAGDSFETLLNIGKDNYDFKGKTVADFALASFLKVCDDMNINIEEDEDINTLKNHINNRVKSGNGKTIAEYLTEQYGQGYIVFTGKKGEKITLKFDGKSYEGFNQVMEFENKIDRLLRSENKFEAIENIRELFDSYTRIYESMGNIYMVDQQDLVSYLQDIQNKINNISDSEMGPFIEEIANNIKKGYFTMSDNFVTKN